MQTDAIWFDWTCTLCFDGNELSEHGDEYQEESRACKIKVGLINRFLMGGNFKHDV